ncbi:MAG: 3-oxoacyl-ACP synthase [Bacteroidetes bacterium]|nr:3-oxoacyl-ACP synthase [Bacteroidota bacterium]
MSLFITKYCSIKNNQVSIDGNIDFTFKDSLEFGKFIRAAYRYYKIRYPKFFKMDNLCKLGFLTAEILLKDQKILQSYTSDEISIILTNSSSSLETDEKHFETIKDRDHYYPSPSIFVYTLPNIMSGEISIRHKIKGENAVFICEKYDPDFIYNQAKLTLGKERVKSCITGRVEYYDNNYESLLFLVEKENNIKDKNVKSEFIIFNVANLDEIYKS